MTQGEQIFVPISSKQEDIYKELTESLQRLYFELESEIHPINIREELTLPCNNINLNSVSRSKLYARRPSCNK